MTSPYATDARETYAKYNSFALPIFRDKKSGLPVEGQIPISYVDGAAAGAVNDFYEIQTIAGGTQLTLTKAQAVNFIGRHLVIKCNSPVASPATTLVLSGGINFNAGSTTTATFSTTLESVLELYFTGTSSAPVVSVGTVRNVTLS